MARPLRIEFSGAVYHITSRGNAREPIFIDKQDKKNFLKVLCLVVKRFNWLLHAYCLMDNHYHLLVETPEANLSKGMRQLNGQYTQTFNWKQKRVGHLFQGRYKAIIVDKDNYLLALCRYIVLNPVRIGIVKKPKDWQWSSYNATVGSIEPIACLTTDWILSQFGKDKNKAKRKYIDFVAETKEESPWEALIGQIILGKSNFVEKITGLLKGREEIKEIPRTQRYAIRPMLEELLAERKDRNKEEFDRFISEAYKYGYTMREIAENLGVHYSTISRIIKRWERNIKR